MKSIDRNFYHLISGDMQREAQAEPLAFRGDNKEAFLKWRGATCQMLREGLNIADEKVPLRFQVVDSISLGTYIREKVIYDLDAGLSAVAWICRPNADGKVKLPAIICCHGHGPGKDPLVGLYQGNECFEYHKRAAVRLAEKGFVTLVPDRRGYGECSPFLNGYPEMADLKQLDEFYLRSGPNLLSLDIFDAARAVDVLFELTFVDSDKIGCLGIEAGAAVAAGVAALDERVKVVSLTSFISSAVESVRLGGLNQSSIRIGSADLCSLIAPRPLLLQIPLADPVVPLVCARKAIPLMRNIYSYFDVKEKCAGVEFDGVLELDYPTLENWFIKWNELTDG